MVSVLLLELLQGSAYLWILAGFWPFILLFWLVCSCGTFIELLAGRWASGAILGTALLCLVGWATLKMTGVGETVIVRHTMANGTRLVWTQSYEPTSEPYSVYLYFQRPDEPWYIIQYEFEDTRWLTGSIRSEGNTAMIWRWLPVASFSSESGELFNFSTEHHSRAYPLAEFLSKSDQPAFLND